MGYGERSSPGQPEGLTHNMIRGRVAYLGVRANTVITTQAKTHRANIRTARRELGQIFDYSSVVVWEGNSPVNGDPIVAVVTNLKLASENRKTGDMAQMYIMPRDSRPVDSISNGDDAAVCGACPLRPVAAKIARAAGNDADVCYVNKGWLGRQWDSIPNLPRVSPEIVGQFLTETGLEFREGAWGDPATVPMEVRRALNVGRGTSYTHQWNTDWVEDDVAEFSMASVQTVDEKNAANAKGYRTYRVTEGELETDEILCPEITNNANCKDCGLCAGNRVQAKNIVIRPI